MNNLIESGNDLLIGRETVPGASAIKLQLESTKSRWETIENKAAARQQELEDKLVKVFQADVQMTLTWIQEKENQVENTDVIIPMHGLDAFVQV